MMVRDFQSVIGREARRQILHARGAAARLPGRLRRRRQQRDGALLPVPRRRRRARWSASRRPATGVETGRHAASITGGTVGVLHGKKTYVLQDELGQMREAHSISAGLDYPGVGPEHAYLHDTGRAHVRRGHRRRGGRGAAAADRDRGHHPGARERARDRPRDASSRRRWRATRSSSSTCPGAATRT